MTGRWRITTWVHKNYVLEIRDRDPLETKNSFLWGIIWTVGEIQGIGFLMMTTMVMALEQLRNSTTGWIANKGGGDFFSWPNWDEETYPEIQDLVLIPLFAILFTTLRFFLDKFVFEVRYVFSQAQQQLLLHILFLFLFFLAPNRQKCSGIGNPSSGPKILFFFFFSISLVMMLMLMIPMVLNPLISPNKEFQRYIAKSTELIVG